MLIPRTAEQLMSFITDKISESNHLDYKAANAISRSDNKKKELTKDISSFANSAGGMIVFGIKEHSSPDKRHLPEHLDPINAHEFSKEWLDQIIGLIQPRIDGIEIIPVHIGPSDSDYCYVVNIPQSETAHQATDFRYYKRRNFESTPMEDYEIRDVMNRRKTPRLEVQVRIINAPFRDNSHIAFRVHNLSRVLARHYSVVVHFPVRISSGFIFIEEGKLDREDGKAMWTFSRGNGIGAPLFPNSKITLKQKIQTGVKMEPDPGESIDDIKLRIYADEMDYIEEFKNFQKAEKEWA